MWISFFFPNFHHFSSLAIALASSTPPLKFRLFYAMETDILTPAYGRNLVRCFNDAIAWVLNHFLDVEAMHALMYFNANFTLTKKHSSNYVLFPLGRREKLLADKFIHFIYAYLFDATALIWALCIESVWKAQSKIHSRRECACITEKKGCVWKKKKLNENGNRISDHKS